MFAITASQLYLYTLAIIAPPAEAQWLTDYVLAREMPHHVAAVIAIIALFMIAWTLLSDSPQRHRSTNGPGATHQRT